MQLPSAILRSSSKKFLYFLIFQKVELLKYKKVGLILRTFLYFRKLLIFQEVTFRASKMKKPFLKKCLIFLEIELSIHKLKNLHIF